MEMRLTDRIIISSCNAAVRIYFIVSILGTALIMVDVSGLRKPSMLKP